MIESYVEWDYVMICVIYVNEWMMMIVKVISSFFLICIEIMNTWTTLVILLVPVCVCVSVCICGFKKVFWSKYGSSSNRSSSSVWCVMMNNNNEYSSVIWWMNDWWLMIDLVRNRIDTNISLCVCVWLFVVDCGLLVMWLSIYSVCVKNVE